VAWLSSLDAPLRVRANHVDNTPRRGAVVAAALGLGIAGDPTTV